MSDSPQSDQPTTFITFDEIDHRVSDMLDAERSKQTEIITLSIAESFNSGFLKQVAADPASFHFESQYMIELPLPEGFDRRRGKKLLTELLGVAGWDCKIFVDEATLENLQAMIRIEVTPAKFRPS
jgi:hypothetical protein